jgi:Ran GTPase-activating protein (RanGAP) involved in mRNA processing and transport
VRHAHFVAQLIKACPVLRILKLNDCRLGAQGAVDIAAVLTANLTLHELHIAANQIHDRGMAALVKALKGNQGLQTFNFGDNSLSADGAKLLGDMLEKNPHITNLSLGVNKFGDIGINHIYHGIKCNTTYARLIHCPHACACLLG